MALRRRGRSGIGVGFFVVMMGEMVKCLERVRGVGVVGDAVLAGAVEVLEAVESREIMLVRGGLVIRGEEGESRRNVGASGCREPVDGANDALVDFGTALEIWVGGIGSSDRIDGETGTPRSHVGNLFHFVDAKTVSSMFGECCLSDVNGNSVVVLA